MAVLDAAASGNPKALLAEDYSRIFENAVSGNIV